MAHSHSHHDAHSASVSRKLILATIATVAFVVVQLFAGFLSAFANLEWGTAPWKHKAFARPRKSAYVDFGDKFGTCTA